MRVIETVTNQNECKDTMWLLFLHKYTNNMNTFRMKFSSNIFYTEIVEIVEIMNRNYTRVLVVKKNSNIAISAQVGPSNDVQV